MAGAIECLNINKDFMSKKIVVKLDNKKLHKLKSILALREGELKDLSVTNFRYGKLGDEMVISFNVDDEHHRSIVGKLIINDLKLLQPDDQTLKIIEDAQVPTSMGFRLTKSMSWDELKEKASSSVGNEASGLDEYISNGSYEKVIQILKDIKNNSQTIERAKNGLPAAVAHAIEDNYQKGVNNKYEADKHIAALIKIASDDKLKSLRQFDSLKSAGLRAIELCEIHKENLDELIKICNNSSLVNSVNVLAAIVFARNTIRDIEGNKETLDYAAKNLNVRWLNIAFDIVEFEFGNSEKEYFTSLIEYVKANR